ncbi:MAG: epoxyqueuosine reductase [Chloroflexi bacterium]|nr:epoxyqueuosine reductase [Chloroflexota bacterium]
MANVRENLALIAAVAGEAGMDLLGVADVREGRDKILQLSPALLEQLPLAVVIATRLSPAILSSLEGAPNLVYYHHYKTVNALLDQAALRISREITGSGYLALPVAASQLIDWDQQLGHLSHKAAGYLAGLGWRGRNNLLVTERFGAQVRLATILTNLPLEADRPVSRDCGDCFRCLAVCPVAAIKENVADFDSAACYQQLRRFSKELRLGHNICGLCVQACPGGAASGKTGAC